MIKRVLIVFIIIIIFFSETVNGFYSYKSKFDALSINRNAVRPNFNISYDNSQIKMRNS